MTPDVHATSIWDADVPDRLAIVLGSEGPGLDDTTLQTSTRQVRIPLRPNADSLNVGHAAAITFAIAAHRVETMGLEPTTPTLQR